MERDITKLMKLLTENVPLHMDLVPFVYIDGIIPMIHHPLIVEFYSEMKNGLINKQYEYKKTAIEKSKAENDWLKFIFLHERPYRFPAMLRVINEQKPISEDYWKMVSSVWIDSENIFQHIKEWEKIWNTQIPNRSSIMNDEERNTIDNLPDVVDVWRGVNIKKGVRGMSWTINKDKAVWFSKRFKSKKSFLIHGQMKKHDILAYFTGRNEQEIVSLPKNIKIIITEKLI